MTSRPRFALLLVALSLTGIASAQVAGADFSPTWDRKPRGSDVMRWFPRAALHDNFVGIAALCCTVGNDGELSCTVGMEWPRDIGLGAAALGLSSKYRMSRDSVAQFHAAGAKLYPLRIPFFVEPASREAEDLRERMTAIASRPEICAPATPTS